jgi:hypothetical protein
MRYVCRHCRRCFAPRQISNAHTEYWKGKTQVHFGSTDDRCGVWFCKVCFWPLQTAKIWNFFRRIWQIN